MPQKSEIRASQIVCNDASIMVGLRVVYHSEYLLSINKKYIPVPESIIQSKDPTKAFSTIPELFYPLCIVDENDIAQGIETPMIMFVKLRTMASEEYEYSAKFEPMANSAKSTSIDIQEGLSSAYCFSAITCFLHGSMEITFSCPTNPSVKPLVKNVTVVPSAKSKSGTIVRSPKTHEESFVTNSDEKISKSAAKISRDNGHSDAIFAHGDVVWVMTPRCEGVW